MLAAGTWTSIPYRALCRSPSLHCRACGSCEWGAVLQGYCQQHSDGSCHGYASSTPCTRHLRKNINPCHRVRAVSSDWHHAASSLSSPNSAFHHSAYMSHSYSFICSLFLLTLVSALLAAPSSTILSQGAYSSSYGACKALRRCECYFVQRWSVTMGLSAADARKTRNR